MDRGYDARVSDEDIEPPEARKQRLYCMLCALCVAYVRDDHENLRAWYGFEDCVLCFTERLFRAGHYRERRSSPCILQGDLQPDPSRGARDEHDFVTVSLGVV